MGGLVDQLQDELDDIDDVSGDEAALRAIAEENDTQDDDAPDDDGDDAGKQGGAKVDDAAALEKADPVTVPVERVEPDNVTPPDNDDDFYTPPIIETLPADHQEKIAALNEQREAVMKKFHDGDIEIDVVFAEQAKIDADLRKLELQEMEIRMSAKHAEKAAAEQWERTCSDFFADKRNAIYTGNPVLMKALDAEVQEVSVDQNFSHRSGAKILEEAHRRVIDGIKKASESIQPEVPKPKPQNNVSAIDANPPPVTLSGVASSSVDKSEDAFASLDALDGPELEAAVAALTPAQRRAYVGG